MANSTEFRFIRDRLKSMPHASLKAFTSGPPFIPQVIRDGKRVLAAAINVGEVAVDHSQPLRVMLHRAGIAAPPDLTEEDYPFDTEATETFRFVLLHVHAHVQGLRAAANLLAAIGLFQATHAHVIEIVRTHKDQLSLIGDPIDVGRVVPLRPVSQIEHRGPYVLDLMCSHHLGGWSISEHDLEQPWYYNHGTWFVGIAPA